MALLPAGYFPPGFFPLAYFAQAVSSGSSSGTGGSALPPSYFPTSYFPSGYFAPGYFGPQAASLPVLLTLSVTVGYLPNPATSALQIVETGQVFGPYFDSVTANGDGTYTLTIGLTAIPPGLAPGPVQIQPGDVLGGVFVPDGLPITGTLSGATTGTALDWDVLLSAPLVDIAEGTNILEVLAGEFVHLCWSVTDADTGTPIILTGNSSVVSVAMAIVHGQPGSADWQPATIITRAVGDDTDGEYTQVKVGLGQALVLTEDTYRVYGRLITTGETIVQKAPGYLIVQD